MMKNAALQRLTASPGFRASVEKGTPPRSATLLEQLEPSQRLPEILG